MKQATTNYIQVTIHPKKIAPIERRHPWIFSGAIIKIEGNPRTGEIVEVCDRNGKYLATGYYQKSKSIAIRLISFEQTAIDEDFWTEKIQNAYDYRQKVGLPNAETNVFRLINGEGDGLSGLIIDIYHQVAVIQIHSVGMYHFRPLIVNALRKVLGDALKAIYDKSAETLPKEIGFKVENSYLLGNKGSSTVHENGLKFWVDWELGQKTGFFVDQRNNRQLLSQYVKGKTVLNAFCYSGGFSIYALQAGAKMVHSVDSSQKAMDWTNKNVELNGFDSSQHQGFSQQVATFLQEQEGETYDVMILDPPAYAKHRSAKHKAIHGYKNLNIKALRHIKPGGILFTFSCSQVIDRQLFMDTIRAAAIESKREIRILHQLGQPEDHPVNIFHPEGEYLKGLVLYIV